MATPTSSSSVSRVTGPSTRYIASLLAGTKWGGGAGSGVDLTYSFPGSGAVWSTASRLSGGYGSMRGGGEPWNGFAPLNEAQKAAFRAALATWAEVANIRFVEVADTATQCGDIRVAFSSGVSSTSSAYAYYPYGSNGAGGDVWLNPAARTNSSPQAGNFGFHTLVHEIGHALGLKHSFDGSPVLPSGTENNLYTVMSYTDPPNASIFPAGPMLYDIAAIQYLYGANTSTRAGNDTYTFSNSAEELKAIWDADGIDTFDVSNQTRAATIDLNPGAFSSIGVRQGGSAASRNIAIAYNVVIENAIGGSGNDSITGNSAGNTVSAGPGNDLILCLEGNDTVNGNTGSDLVYGNTGTDLLLGGRDNDTLYGGRDDDYLGGNIGADGLYGDLGQDTLYGGQDNDTLFGGQGNDLLSGDLGNDWLYGDRGDDTLMGGLGADRYVVTSVSGRDVIIDFDPSGGDRIVLSNGLSARAVTTGSELLLVFGSGAQVTLAGVSASTPVRNDWFVFG